MQNQSTEKIFSVLNFVLMVYTIGKGMRITQATQPKNSSIAKKNSKPRLNRLGLASSASATDEIAESLKTNLKNYDYEYKSL